MKASQQTGLAGRDLFDRLRAGGFHEVTFEQVPLRLRFLVAVSSWAARIMIAFVIGGPVVRL